MAGVPDAKDETHLQVLAQKHKGCLAQAMGSAVYADLTADEKVRVDIYCQAVRAYGLHPPVNEQQDEQIGEDIDATAKRMGDGDGKLNEFVRLMIPGADE